MFGDYISVYDIQRAVADKATVPIYYERRLAKLGSNAKRAAEDRRGIRRDTEGEELTRKEKLKTKWVAARSPSQESGGGTGGQSRVALN